jgi:hypothetical protein
VDFVRIKMGTLYSSVRKLLKRGDRKLSIIHRLCIRKRTYQPKISLIEESEITQYHTRSCDTHYQTLIGHHNNPNAVRKSKRFFASDMIKVNDPEKETYLKAFSIEDVLKLNIMDKRNDIDVARAQSRQA